MCLSAAKRSLNLNERVSAHPNQAFLNDCKDVSQPFGLVGLPEELFTIFVLIGSSAFVHPHRSAAKTSIVGMPSRMSLWGTVIVWNDLILLPLILLTIVSASLFYCFSNCLQTFGFPLEWIISFFGIPSVYGGIFP